MENRREWIAVFAGALAGVGEASAKSLPDQVRAADAAEKITHPFGEQRVYYQGETGQLGFLEAGSLRLGAGRSPHAPHKHAEEEIMLVAEGTGEISIEGETAKCAPGSMMYCAAERLHGIVNTGDEPLLFYYFKWKTKE